MPRFAANLTMMFTELAFLDRFAAAAAAGFKAASLTIMVGGTPRAWSAERRGPSTRCGRCSR